MGPPNSQRDVQKLTGCIASLSRFISRLGVRGLPLFRLLKKQEDFVWTEEAQSALDELKVYLSSIPVLVPPEPGEKLQLYISATTQVVSTVLTVYREEEGHIQ